LRISAAQVFDQRDAAACAALGINRDDSDVRWDAVLAQGRDPPCCSTVLLDA
jgi:hypothetical protein